MNKLLLILLMFLQLSPKLSGAAKRDLSLDLSPARWVWYPSGRTLQHTFVLFRKEVNIDKEVISAKGWMLADSNC